MALMLVSAKMSNFAAIIHKKTQNRMIKRTATALAALLCIGMTAKAEGYQINTLSARQLGMGHTGTALHLGAESMIFNPAGMGFANTTFDFTGSITGIKADATTIHDGQKYHTDNGISTPIALNASFRIYDNLQAGVAFYTPYGSSIDWGRDWPGAVLNSSVDLRMFTIQPTLAWRITPRLSVGAGLMMTWGNVDLHKALVSASTFDHILGAGLSNMLGLPADYRFGNTSPASVGLKGTSQMAFGANIGVMYDINDRWTLGASFRTRMTMTVKKGDATVSYANEVAEKVLEDRLNMINAANFKASMPAPYVLGMGVSFRPTDRLTLALDAQLTGWNTYKSLDIEFLNDIASAYNQHIVKNYHNSWAFKAGAQYALTHRFDIRAGLMVDTDPVDINHYNPETPGMTKIEPTVGFSFRPIEHLSIDLAFMYIAGLGKDGASCTYPDLLAASVGQMFPQLQLPAQKTFKPDYRVHAFAPSIGISYKF